MAGLFIETEIRERLPHIEIGLAGADDGEVRRSPSITTRSMPLARAKAVAAGSRWLTSVSSSTSGGRFWSQVEAARRQLR